MEQIAELYTVTRPQGMNIGGLQFPAGALVYRSWVEEPGGMTIHRMMDLDMIALAGTIPAEQVPTLDAFIAELAALADVSELTDPPVPSIASAVVEAATEGLDASPSRAGIVIAAFSGAETETPEVGEQSEPGEGAGLPDPSAEIAARALAGSVDPDPRVADERIRTRVERWSIPKTLAYAVANPDQLGVLIDGEKKGKGRTTLLGYLEALTPPPPPDPLAGVPTLDEAAAEVAAELPEAAESQV